MKRLFAILIVTALLLSLAACGGSGTNSRPEPDMSGGAAAPVPQADEGPGAASAEETPEPPDDDALAEAEKAKLIGEWTMEGVNEIALTFREDGTGAYRFLSEKTVAFTYLVTVSHREFANGAPYDVFLLKMSYDTGETEDILFFFNDETGHLAFHNSENGGYNGVIDYAEWTRKP